MKRSGPPQRRTALKRGKPMARARSASKPRSPNDFPEQVRLAAARRSGYRCEAKTRVCTGTASAFHHRKLRGHHDQRLVNCLHVCRSCHDRIHANPTLSYLMGWLVHSYDDPATIPAKHGEGPPRDA